MLFIPGTDDYDSSQARIGDMSVIQGVVKKTGRRAVVVAAPEPPAPPVSKDVTRRSDSRDMSDITQTSPTGQTLDRSGQALDRDHPKIMHRSPAHLKPTL